jgi:hypothetical protein
MYYFLKESTRKGKKYSITLPDNKIVHFGAIGYEDYTMHHDDKRKDRYISRHKKEDWTDLSKAGTWSRYILWNKKTLNSSIDDMEDRFDIKIKLL